MKITLTQTGKRYNREWIFRGFDHEFKSSYSYAITGPNGSGKSTLLQVIAGAVMASEGKIVFTDGEGREMAEAEAYKEVSIVAPYLELIEEMTAMELLHFHQQFKPLLLSIEDCLHQVGLKKAAHKQIRYFSSGMKQRLKLAQAFLSQTQILLLDEPTTNLDASGIELYHHLMAQFTDNRILIVCSNDKNEYEGCKEIISIEKYK